MTEYEQWGDSRWEFTKNQSSWHFDPSVPPTPGTDSYTHVCRFTNDFTQAIVKCLPEAKASTWSSRNNYDKKIEEEGLYSATPEENDLIRAGANPKMEVFKRTEAKDVELFRRVARWLGLEDPSIKFHNQTTGQMLVWHIDNFAARPERDNSYKVTEFDKDPLKMRRFAVMLDDWKHGQVFQLGNAFFTQWKAGDCITWEWRDMPHATCNMGWWDRPMLQLTGYTTETTNEILSKSNKNWYLEV